MAEIILEITNSYVGRFFLVAGLFVVALLILEATTKSPRSLGRFSYGLFYIFVAGVQIVLPHLFISIAEINVDVAASVWLGATAILMVVFAQFSRRRSVDGYGYTSNALFAVIPIICLILIFKRPFVSSRVANRTNGQLAGRILVFVVSGIAILFSLSFIQVVLQEMNRDAVVNVRDLPIERAVRIQAAILDANTPQYIDAETMLSGASASGRMVKLEYWLTGNSADLSKEIFETIMAPTVARNVCIDPLFRDLVNRGATVVFSYTSLSSEHPMSKREVTVTQADCP